MKPRTRNQAHFINERAPVLDLKDKEWGRSFAQRLIKNPSTSPKMRCRALFVQGILSGDPTTSLPLFAQLQRESPPSARVCELLGSLNGFLQKWGELQRFSLLSLEIDPNFYHSHYTLGVAAKQISDLPKAINHYKTFIEVCPKDARKSVDALFGVAHCYTRLSLPSEGSMGKPPSKEMLAEATKYYNLGVAREKELSPFWGVSEQGDRQILESMLPLLEASGR